MKQSLTAEQKPDSLCHSFLNSEIHSASSEGVTSVPGMRCCIIRLDVHLATLRQNVDFQFSVSTWKIKSPRSFATCGATHLEVCCYCHHFIWFWYRTVLGAKHTFCLHTLVTSNIYFCMVTMFVIVDIVSVSPNHIFVMVTLLSPSN
jgi:hypothetical protein